MKSKKVKFYKMRREDGEVFEIKENIVESKKNQGYEMVEEEPIIRDINTSQHYAQEKEQKEEKKEDEEKKKSVEDLSYNELQSFVSKRTEDYKVVGKSTKELAQKAQELVD